MGEYKLVIVKTVEKLHTVKATSGYIFDPVFCRDCYIFQPLMFFMVTGLCLNWAIVSDILMVRSMLIDIWSFLWIAGCDIYRSYRIIFKLGNNHWYDNGTAWL